MSNAPDLFPASDATPAPQGEAAPRLRPAKSPAKSPAKTETMPSPMMAQYLKLREAHKGYLLFYRMGDFYELFLDDALTAAEALDITLTHRGQLEGKPVPMCGVPAHAADAYLHRLIRKGFKVAICEQQSEADSAQKSRQLMSRGVVRLITPGTLSEDSLLPSRAHNFLASLVRDKTGASLAWLDMSTGDFGVAEETLENLWDNLARLAPSELLLPPALASLAKQCKELVPNLTISVCESDAQPAKAVLAHYDTTIQAAVSAYAPLAQAACAQLLGYVKMTQLDVVPRLRLSSAEKPAQMYIDAIAVRNLELVQTQTGTRKGSLLALIDKTVSAAGARELQSRLLAPLCDVAGIEQRLLAVAQCCEDVALREQLREHLRTLPDIARAVQRLAMGRGGPRDLAAVRDGYHIAHLCAQFLADKNPQGELARAKEMLPPLPAIYDRLKKALGENLPLHARDGNFIAQGFAPALDEIRKLRDESRRVIAQLQERYSTATGVKALKIKHNAVLGYHIETPSAHANKLATYEAANEEQKFLHRQTLTNVARFSSQELTNLGSEIERAGEKMLGLEQEIFAELTQGVLAEQEGLFALAQGLAVLDVASALGTLAQTQNWVRPTMSTGTEFIVRTGRHPVVEEALRATSAGAFIANDCAVGAPTKKGGEDSAQIMLLTGPNMAGKSTYLRQNGLIAILAQMGSFVPAQSATIGLVDRVFCRVGAGDDLARGRSTFMMEMEETASILQNATEKSFVILDELGRGTATFDGLSIAWAVLEHLHESAKCRSLFATHYHELTALEAQYPRIANYAMQVAEDKNEIVFLHEIGKGASSRSYGVYVAELAGLPKAVTQRARQLLQALEENGEASKRPAFLQNLPASAPAQTSKDALRESLAQLDPDTLTPLEALDLVFRLKKQL